MLAAAGALCVSAPPAPAQTPQVTTFGLDTFTHPWGITVGWDGNLWFTQHEKPQIGRIPADATDAGDIDLFSYAIPGETIRPWAGGIAPANDGNLWFTIGTEAYGGDRHLGRVGPSGAINLWQISADTAAEHYPPVEITHGPTAADDSVWFTQGPFNGPGGTLFGRVGRREMTTRAISHITVRPPDPPGARPVELNGITTGPDGNLWIADRTYGRVGRLTTSGNLTWFNTPRVFPHAVAVGPDGSIWFTGFGFGQASVGRIPTEGTDAEIQSAVDVFEVPGSGPPGAIAPVHDGRMWFSTDEKLGTIQAHGSDAEVQASVRTYEVSPFPESFDTRGLVVGPDGAVWATNQFYNQIKRITTGLSEPQARTPLGATIDIPSSGAASEYPSELEVAGLEGTITRVRVDLYGLFHEWPEDLDVLLVGPDGRRAMLLSDAGSDRQVLGSSFSIDAAAPFGFPVDSGQARLTTGRYRPTNVNESDSMPAPAPAGPHPADLSAFAGGDPNGTWRLYVADDAPGLDGQLLGWGLRIETTATEPPPPPPPPPGGGDGPPAGDDPRSGRADFSFARVKRNAKRGTAKVVVRVSAPGAVALKRTKKVRGSRAVAESAGRVRLQVRPRGKLKRRLAAAKRVGGRARARVRLRVVYTPVAGTPITKSKRIKLVRRG